MVAEGDESQKRINPKRSDYDRIRYLTRKMGCSSTQVMKRLGVSRTTVIRALQTMKPEDKEGNE